MARSQLRLRRPLTARAVDDGAAARPETLVESYRRLAEVFHEVLSEQSLDALLDRIAGTLADLMPYEALHIYEADEERARARAGVRALAGVRGRDHERAGPRSARA